MQLHVFAQNQSNVVTNFRMESYLWIYRLGLEIYPDIIRILNCIVFIFYFVVRTGTVDGWQYSIVFFFILMDGCNIYGLW